MRESPWICTTAGRLFGAILSAGNLRGFGLGITVASDGPEKRQALEVSTKSVETKMFPEIRLNDSGQGG